MLSTRHRGRIACSLGLLGCGALLVASRLSQLWLPLDVLSNFTLQMFVLMAAFAVGFVMPFARTLTALVLALTGITGIGLYPQYVSEQSRTVDSVKPGERQLRLMTFNTSVINRDTHAIAAEILRLDPDVATLMEFSEKKHVVLDQLKANYPYMVGCVPGRHCHFALLSKIPIADSKVREGWKGPLMVQATLDGAFSGLTIVSVHFPRIPDIKDQFYQLGVLLDYLDQQRGTYVLMGDFNATPFSDLLVKLTDHTKLRRLTGIPSWPSYAGLPQFGIDNIFVDDAIRLLEKARIGRPSGSDHYPVTVTIAVPALLRGAISEHQN
jgi:endonuclease/exonuclease/phosphatase (EEP) superfamily protein YafD